MTASENRISRFKTWLQARGPATRPLIGDDGRGVSRAVVIPVLAESKTLLETLGSLAKNPSNELQNTLVICVVNNRAEPHARVDQIEDNLRVLEFFDNHMRGVMSWDEGAALRLAYIDAASPGNELAAKMGVGEARRIGLDCALAVLCDNEAPDGLLISLDGDSLVEANYLEEIRRHFSTDDAGAAVVAYAHPLPTDKNARRAILLYEVFLRYHELGLRAAGSPYALPTIGSTIVVRGGAYVAAGGMNRKQAGEDFYFLQQLVKTGSVSRLDSTTVFPSPRESDRVPFGTGASVSKHMGGDDGLRTVYHPESYRILGRWLACVRDGLESPAEALLAQGDEISRPLGEFLRQQGFDVVWPKLQQNAPDPDRLEQQFHRWFDGFRSLKLIHFLRDHGFGQMAVEIAVADLMPALTMAAERSRATDDLSVLLDQMRSLCRQ